MSIPCIVLVGGLGTRLRSAVPNLPKCLAPIAGAPFLAWQLRSLAERGVTQFVLALGYGADQVLESLGESWACGLYIETVIEDAPLGTGGAVRHAMIEKGIDEALIANGDTFLGGSLHSMLAPLELSDSELMRIATFHTSDRTRFGGVTINKSCRVTAFLEKGNTDNGLINAGLYRVHKNAFDSNFSSNFSLESELMPCLLAQGMLQARELSGPFIDIGVPDDYHHFNTHIYDYVHKD